MQANQSLCFAVLGIRRTFLTTGGTWNNKLHSTCYQTYHSWINGQTGTTTKRARHSHTGSNNNKSVKRGADLCECTMTNMEDRSVDVGLSRIDIKARTDDESGNGVVGGVDNNAGLYEENGYGGSERYHGEIFCNRALNMAKIEAVGFDMDYTLAMYKAEQFEALSCKGALKKLVNALGYPIDLLDVQYNHDFFIRGLVVDKHRGNVLKLDRHKYVKHALHGFRELNRGERSLIYDSMTQGGGGFQEPDFACLDTIFSIPDAFLFATLVHYKNEHPETLKHKSYMQLYHDVRKSVDLCHRDGVIKDEVARNPANYIEADPHMVDALTRIKSSGRKVFLLTNSLWNYTNVVMRFLYKACGFQEEEWPNLFDLVITGSNKPAFITNKQLSLYRCDPQSGLLSNTEGPVASSVEDYMKDGKTFQGGNWLHLHKLLDVSDGTKILYIGDHIYSDVVRSKRTLGWRTMLVIPELEGQINAMLEAETKRLAAEILELKSEREETEEIVDRYEVEVVTCGKEMAYERKKKVEYALQQGKKTLQAKRVEIAELTDRLNARYHPVWGQLFKTGLQNSRFAEQVEDYACLYTSRVSNIRLVSPEMHWRTMPDVMPHDRLHLSPMRRILSLRRNAA
eukprot:Plantae.Rhodophyta-Hildenbrandia_rubra.ctg2667.p2 GENE.Plantae.Rhodophyta-Hildenbrandia_rubra.ctg2667~~Plantae.Rhodophyta-Hildenbrandia_rubra.ctg2667.p2  ORF type:complete len:625 (+),score=102.45 Plantae.Rhodophyta-Hildenbrandia_rubra.ctg2667:123-1997(+)